MTYEARACGCVLAVSRPRPARVVHDGVDALVHRAGDEAALDRAPAGARATDRELLAPPARREPRRRGRAHLVARRRACWPAPTRAAGSRDLTTPARPRASATAAKPSITKAKNVTWMNANASKVSMPTANAMQRRRQRRREPAVVRPLGRVRRRGEPPDRARRTATAAPARRRRRSRAGCRATGRRGSAARSPSGRSGRRPSSRSPMPKNGLLRPAVERRAEVGDAAGRRALVVGLLLDHVARVEHRLHRPERAGHHDLDDDQQRRAASGSSRTVSRGRMQRKLTSSGDQHRSCRCASRSTARRA